MNKATQLAKELLASLETAEPTSGPIKTRMEYWRQRCGEARGLVRDNDVLIDKALTALADATTQIKALKAKIATQRKTWIGPKVPPKSVQRPHRVNSF